MTWETAQHVTHRASEGPKASREALLVVDANAPSPIVDRVTQMVSRFGLKPQIRTTPVPSHAALSSLSAACKGTGVLFGVGGGTTLDLVKLARAWAFDDRAAGSFQAKSRAGLLCLHQMAPDTPPIIAIPTTIGTGAERSHLAVDIDSGRRRLVLGASLIPEIAILDADATSGLPPDLMRDGTIEIIARLTHPALPDDGKATVFADQLSDATLRFVLALGWKAARQGWRLNRDDRLRLAQASSFTHGPEIMNGRIPFGAKIWPLANELAAALGTTKMEATVALWPTVWDRIANGDDRLGRSERLMRVWELIREASPFDLGGDPALGIRQMFEAWGASDSLSATQATIAETARLTHLRWGAGLPVLHAFSRDELHGLLAAAVIVKQGISVSSTSPSKVDSNNFGRSVSDSSTPSTGPSPVVATDIKPVLAIPSAADSVTVATRTTVGRAATELCADSWKGGGV